MKSISTYRPGVHAVAIFAALLTLPLLYVGGSVTTYRVGLAVPDWPTTFQENMFRYDFWNAPFGVKVEHVHRLYGAAVGMATILLTVCLVAVDSRWWMKFLGVLALVAVIGQGVLGGLRVTHLSTVLAAVHGCTGQAFFGFLVAICVFTGRDWALAGGGAVDRRSFRLMASIALALVYAQVLAGGWLRHFATSDALYFHAALAAGIAGCAGWLGIRIHARRGEVPALVGPSLLLLAALGGQVLLGVASLVVLWPLDGTARPVPMIQAIIRTLHQTNAAIVFAATIVLTLRAFRHLAGRPVHGDARQADRMAGRPEPAALDWEAVA